MTTSLNPSVLITGCSSGFGRQMVTDFLEDGWRVFATMRRATERRTEFADELARFGSRLTILECDITLTKDRHDVSDALEQAGLGLDCLINNAGNMLLGALEDTSESQLRSQMETNFFGAVLLIQQLLPLLRKNSGTIINVSSIFGFITWPMTSCYCASKYAIEGLTQSLRQELKPHGVRVALLEPGSHPTALMVNLQWGDRDAEEPSLYHSETTAYRAYRMALANRKRMKPTDISQAAINIARGRRPRLRNVIGIGTKAVYLGVRLCPEIIGARLMGWIARRAFREAPATRKDSGPPA